MSEQVKSTAGKAAPWRRDIAWWLVLVEGIVATALGVYILMQPLQATKIIGLLLGAYLIISGFIQFYAGMRAKGESRLVSIAKWRGIIGLVVGIFVALQYFLGFGTVSFGLTVLGLGLLVYGVLGLYLGFIDRGDGMRWGVLLNSLLVTLLGLTMLYGNWTKAEVLTWIGALAIVFGILLIIFAVLRRETDASSESGS